MVKDPCQHFYVLNLSCCFFRVLRDLKTYEIIRQRYYFIKKSDECQRF
jgi:hypothetical protein